MAEEQQSSSTTPPPLHSPRFNKLSREMNYKFRENECIRIAFIHLPPPPLAVATSFWHQSRMPERLIRKLNRWEAAGRGRMGKEKRIEEKSGWRKCVKRMGRHPVKGIYGAAPRCPRNSNKIYRAIKLPRYSAARRDLRGRPPPPPPPKLLRIGIFHSEKRPIITESIEIVRG